jgi:hypothetical protein
MRLPGLGRHGSRPPRTGLPSGKLCLVRTLRAAFTFASAEIVTLQGLQNSLAKGFQRRFSFLTTRGASMSPLRTRGTRSQPLDEHWFSRWAEFFHLSPTTLDVAPSNYVVAKDHRRFFTPLAELGFAGVLSGAGRIIAT